MMMKMPRHKGFFNQLLCCFRPNHNSSSSSNHHSNVDGHHRHGSGRLPHDVYYPSNNQGVAGQTGISCGTGSCGRYLLPPLKSSSSDAKKLCLVIDLDETLVHSSFKPINNADFIVPVEIDGAIHQVYVLKRPHVDEFLQRVGQLYECVLFTASLAKYADPVADLLDKTGVFGSRLFRESCVFYKGNYVKDLSRLGRDLNRVIIMDNSPASYIFHPDNAVPVASWFDDMTDTELKDLIPFFEKLSRVDNIYSVLRNANPQSNNPSPVNLDINDDHDSDVNNQHLSSRIIMSVDNENRNTLNMTSITSSGAGSLTTGSSAVNHHNQLNPYNNSPHLHNSNDLMSITSPNPLLSSNPITSCQPDPHHQQTVITTVLTSVITSVPRTTVSSTTTSGSGDGHQYHPTHHQQQQSQHTPQHHQQQQQSSSSSGSITNTSNNQQGR